MTSIALRPITPEDDLFLAGVYASTRAEELAVTGWSDEDKTVFCRRQFDAQTVHYRENYPGASLQIIERDGVSIGRLYVVRWEREIRIMDIALLPEKRGAGIGTKLLLELQEEARAGSKSLTIHVERFNPALRLYERLGFKQIEDKGVYLLMEWSAAPSKLSS
jgi:ribosomal protein S18 acetylase RimI-like enzyme